MQIWYEKQQIWQKSKENIINPLKRSLELKEVIMSCSDMNRREFVGLTTASIAGGVLGFSAPAHANSSAEVWNPEKPLISTGKKLAVQPVLMYRIPQRRHATSWKSWGGVQTEQAVAEEAARISKELTSLSAGADFSFEILPIAKVKTVEEALQVHKNDYDVIVVYPATGSGDLLRACFAKEKDRDTIIFARHRSGPVYYWYEARTAPQIMVTYTLTTSLLTICRSCSGGCGLCMGLRIS